MDVREGSCLGVCGSNGSGKTTLMRLLSRIYEPDEGRVHVAGRTSALLSMGAGVSTQLSGRDNVLIIAATHGVRKREVLERYEEIRAFAELDEPTMNTPVRYYSAGMRTRLSFAIFAILVPDILLIDEILSVGDASFREKSIRRLRQLTEQARCVVITSHNLDFLRDHCDAVLWLDRGRVMGMGEPKPVVDEYVRFLRA